MLSFVNRIILTFMRVLDDLAVLDSLYDFSVLPLYLADVKRIFQDMIYRRPRPQLAALWLAVLIQVLAYADRSHPVRIHAVYLSYYLRLIRNDFKRADVSLAFLVPHPLISKRCLTAKIVPVFGGESFAVCHDALAVFEIFISAFQLTFKIITVALVAQIIAVLQC